MAVVRDRAAMDFLGPTEGEPVIQRRTQTAAYWQEHIDLSSTDVEYLYDLILDKGEPVTTADLVKALIDRHVRSEEEALRADLSNGRLYQPKDTYNVGERLFFPALGYAFGTVADTRTGSNPDYGDFTVVQVRMEPGDDVREFASGLSGDHLLNRPDGDAGLLAKEDLLSASELYDAHGAFVEEKLVAALNEHGEFIWSRDRWFIQGLLAEIHPGYLNLAEALIEVKRMPVPTAEFLPDLDLPAEIPEQIRVLSLNLALEGDERFDNVGDSGRDIWYLRRLAPEEVVNPPARLELAGEVFDRQDIVPELLLIEREIDDEGSGEEVLGPSRQIYKATLALPYPHWRCGTLPLTVRTRRLFPQAITHHTPVVLVDGQSGARMQGWIVHEASFIHGLKDWYERYRLPVGAYIELERTRDPRIINVNFRPQRLTPMWLKVAAVQRRKLVFQMRKVPISCEHDDLLTIGEDDPAAIDNLWVEAEARGENLLEIMVKILPELIKLSPQSTVHAKTIYSAVNLLRRVAPAPVFALLSTEPRFVSMGGGYWTYDDSLAGARGG
jgi:hypothetical protein